MLNILKINIYKEVSKGYSNKKDESTYQTNNIQNQDKNWKKGRKITIYNKQSNFQWNRKQDGKNKNKTDK